MNLKLGNYWKSIILTVVKIIQFMIWLTYPFVFLLGFVTRFLSNDNATTVSREEITAVSTEGLKGGVINEQENTIIQRILSMKEHTLEEILVPASVVESVKEEDTISKTTIKHSRIPVIGEKGFCIGFLLKDEMKECPNKVAELKHPIASYIDDTTIWDAFMNMAEKHEQITAVIDQYGQFRGIVSFEDILESILGIEIIDENDKEVDHQSLAKAIYRKTMQGK